MLLPQKQTNSKNCLMTAFGTVMGFNTDHMIAKLGHDGAKAGHHWQEIVVAFPDHVIAEHSDPAFLENDGHTITRLEGLSPIHDRFKHYFLTHNLVIGSISQTTDKFHAYSWIYKYQQFYDPAIGARYSLPSDEGGRVLQYMEAFWVVLRPHQIALNPFEKQL